NGWVGGEKGARFSTNDGGLTWQDKTDSTISQSFITDIHFTDAQYGVIANSGLFETNDGGETWNAACTFPVQRDYNVNVNYLSGTPTGKIWAVGQRGLILRYSDLSTGITEEIPQKE